MARISEPALSKAQGKLSTSLGMTRLLRGRRRNQSAAPGSGGSSQSRGNGQAAKGQGEHHIRPAAAGWPTLCTTKLRLPHPLRFSKGGPLDILRGEGLPLSHVQLWGPLQLKPPFVLEATYGTAGSRALRKQFRDGELSELYVRGDQTYLANSACGACVAFVKNSRSSGERLS